MLTGTESDLLGATRTVRGMATVLMFLPGCSTAPTRYLNSLHPQYGQTDLDRDLYECRRENTHPAAQSSSYRLPHSAGAESDARMVVDENMARSCLAARGWHPVASNVAPTPPTTPARQAPSAPTPDEKARTERFQRFARDLLAKPYLQAPPACDDGGWWATKNYIVDLAPSVEASGLRKGDRLLKFGDISLAQYDTVGEAWSKLTRGDSVMVRVDRGGKELLIQLSCRDGAQTWQAGIVFLRAIADGQWQACVDGLREYTRLIRLTPAAMLRMASESHART